MVDSFRTLECSLPSFETQRLRFITVKSRHLRGRGDMTVYVPRAAKTPLPIVTLLHGVYGSHWAWAFKGGAHQTAARLMDGGEITPMVLAMPSDGLWGDGSGYLPHSRHDFARWILDDVPQALIEAGLPVDADSPQFIAGLSMGGYGALRLAAQYPKRFEAASGLSSITHFEQFAMFVEESLDCYDLPAGEQALIDLMLRNKDALPPFRFDCGKDDVLIEPNRELHDALSAAGIPHVYEEYPGEHNWDYWRVYLAETLRFFDSVLS